MKNQSKYSSKKDLNITYLLGAGASYSSVPIWSEQAGSMVQVADSIKRAIESPGNVFDSKFLESDKYAGFDNDQVLYLNSLIEELNYFAEKANSNNTIDSYAYILFKQGNNSELNRLKRVLSIYLDIWQFYQDSMPFRDFSNKKSNKKDFIDKRYIEWLNLITNKDSNNLINRNHQINILNWNYDLQVELAFKNMHQPDSFNCLTDINSKFKFLYEIESDDLDVFHLNGHHGFFSYENEFYSTASTIFKKNYYEYLKNLFDNKHQFKLRGSKEYNYGLINFSWERKLSEKVLRIAAKTDILIIIGYSFPQYNRYIDKQIIDTVKKNSPLYIYYQDPTRDINRVKRILRFEKLEHNENTNEFFVPDEFLYPEDIEVYV